MELRHLRYFVVVAAEEHFGRAARIINVAQPALSRTIQALELELGVELFERLPRGVRLTETGRTFYEDVQRILDDLEAATQVARGSAVTERRSIRVGHPILGRWIGDVFRKVVTGFTTDCPKIIVDLVQMSSFEQLAAIADHKIDVGFAHVYGTLPEGMESMRIIMDALCGVRLGTGHRLADEKSILIEQLRDEPLMIFRRTRNPKLFDHIVEVLRAHGFSGQVTQRAELSMWNWNTMPQDSGWMLSTRADRDEEVAGTVWIPFERFSLEFGLDLVWRAGDDSEAVNAMIAAMRRNGPLRVM